MVEDALAIATDLDYKFDLSIQLGRLETAKVNSIDFVYHLTAYVLPCVQPCIVCQGVDLMFDCSLHTPQFRALRESCYSIHEYIIDVLTKWSPGCLCRL